MSYEGKIIEYVEQGKFICGYVMEESNDKRLKVLNQNGREMNLPLARLIHCSAKSLALNTREDILSCLQEASAQRTSFAPAELQEIWEVASEEDEESFDLALLAELFFGQRTNDNLTASFLRSIIRDKIYFKYKEGKVLVHQSETVNSLLEKKEKEKKQRQFLESSTTALKDIMNGNSSVQWPEKESCLALLRQYYIFGNDYEDAVLAKEIVKEAGLNNPHDIYHLLIRAGVFKKDENFLLERFLIAAEFSEEIQAIVDNLQEATAEDLLAEGRKDFRGLPIFTIDDELTRDFDDALHMEKLADGYLVGIHIADVARIVKPNSKLFNEAKDRLTSLYFADSQIPMLPERLSTDLCSLQAGKPRAALSFLITLDNHGEMKSARIVESVIEVQKRLSYAGVDELVWSGEDEELQILDALTRKLQDHRLANGALIMPVPDVRLQFSANDGIEVKLLAVDTPGRRLVAELMVLANTVAAGFLVDRDIPGIFRSQEPPHRRLMSKPVNDLFINLTQRKQLRPGLLTVEAKPHSSVGVSYYTTVTSPIRRLLDLLMQHQIKGVLQGKGIIFSRDELNGLISTMAVKQGKINTVLRQRQRYWLLTYLQSRQGERLEAFVLARNPRKITIVLKDLLLEADLPSSGAIKAKQGETVLVKIALVKPLDDLLRLEW